MSSNPFQKRIAPKSAVAELLKQGQLMRLTIDTETSGFVRSDTPYATPAAPFITEWGDCLTDIAGNYLNSSQIFPQRPEHLMPQPGSIILQRFSEGPYALESEELDPYFLAMAKINWRIEQAAFAYEDFFRDESGDLRKDSYDYIQITDINKSFKAGKVPGERPGTDIVIPIPLIDDKTGEIVHDFRYHPQKRKISYRLDHFEDNLVYRDQADGSLWKYVDPVLAVRFFNAPYDLPIIRLNEQRVGVDSRDSTFLYSRARLSDTERKKNYLMDTLNLAYATAIYATQGDEGLKIGDLIDPATGKIRKSLAQTALMEKNMGHPNAARMLRGGPFMVHDSSFADLVKAHGAHVDAIMTASIENHCMDLDPWLYGNLARQSDEKTLLNQVLTRPATSNNKELELFSLPRKVAGISHSESLYRFLGTDDQMGRMKRLVFLHTDGRFHQGTNHEGKPYKDMSKDDWVTYLSLKHVRGDPDRPVRVESLRKFPGAVHIKDVFQRTNLAKTYRGKLSAVERDLKYIDENPIMVENIRAAQAEIQRNMRYKEHAPQVTLFEDEVPHLFAGEVPYLDDPESLAALDGSRDIHPIIKTIKNRHDNVYKFMAENDRSLSNLALTAYLIDHYRNYAQSDSLGLYYEILSSSTRIDGFRDVDLSSASAESSPSLHTIAARTAFQSFKSMVQKSYNTRKKAAGSERTIFDDLKNPATGEPFFDDDGNLQLETLEDAFLLRKILRLNVNSASDALNSFTKLANDIYAKKYEGKNYPYKDILDDIRRDRSRTPFITAEDGSRSRKKKAIFTAPRDACDFRKKVGLRIMTDFIAELEKENSSYAQGVIDKNWCKAPNKNQKQRLLFASPDNGEKGATPYIADEHGRALSVSYLKQQHPDVVLAKLKSGAWSEKFHRLGSEPHTLRLIQRFVNLGARDDIPEALYMHLYKADLQNRLWGLPNETSDTARMSTLETFEYELKRLEMAATARNPKLLEKDSNPLLSEAAKAVQFEEGQKILVQCRRWLEDMKRKYPRSPALNMVGRHDAQSGLPLDYIRHTIKRDESQPIQNDRNFILIDVPAYHLRYHHETIDAPLPAKGIAVPNLPPETKSAIALGKPVVFREIETGRLYSGGAVSVHNLSKLKPSQSAILMEKTHQDYARAGQSLSARDEISYIGIENLYPLANTRQVAQGVQSFKLPSAQFDALTFPQFSAFGDTPITTLILPTSYCPQKLEIGKLVRLRESSAAVFSNMGGKPALETGHIYDTTLALVDGMDGAGHVGGYTIEELTEKFRANQNTEAARIFKGSGFTGIDHLEQKLRQWRADGFKTADEKILVAHFEQVNKAYVASGRDERLNMWAMFNALSPPQASFIVNGIHPPPSAYRDDYLQSDID
ncbi:MAG: hypothetical protein ACK4VI_07155 [Alphaproteobacteria bacterium]